MQPVTFARVADTLVTAIDAKPKRAGIPARVRRIEANPRVTLTVDHYDDDWTKLAWVQALAHATITHLDDRARAALEAKYAQYRESTPLTGPLITLSPLRILCWRASG